jgi:hypothetical protein
MAIARKTTPRQLGEVKRALETQKTAAVKEVARQARISGAEDALPRLAQEVNARFTSIAKSMDQADNHRVSAALQLSEARKFCKVIGQQFAEWVEANIESRGLAECKRLAAIGDKGEEGAMQKIADMRVGSAVSSKKSRDKAADEKAQSVLPPHPQSDRVPPSKFDQALELLASVDDSATVEAIATRAAEEAGMSLVSDEMAKAVHRRTNANALDLLKSDFAKLTEDQQLDFVEWVDGQVER